MFKFFRKKEAKKEEPKEVNLYREVKLTGKGVEEETYIELQGGQREHWVIVPNPRHLIIVEVFYEDDDYDSEVYRYWMDILYKTKDIDEARRVRDEYRKKGVRAKIHEGWFN